MASSTTKTMWWLKSSAKPKTPTFIELQNSTNRNSQNEEISSSLADFLEKERDLNNIISDNTVDDVDIESILDEINRISIKSSLGPIIQGDDDRPIDDILKEAEKIYMETSKSFDQLSQRSRTSQNLTDVFNSVKSDESTPTPKSISPLPFDEVEVKTPVIEPNKSIQSIYSLRNMLTDAYKENLETPVSDVIKTTQIKTFSKQPLKENVNSNNISINDEYSADFNTTNSSTDDAKNNNSVKSEIVPKLNLSSEKLEQIQEIQQKSSDKGVFLNNNNNTGDNVELLKREMALKDEKIQNLLFDNEKCKEDITLIEKQIREYQDLLKEATATFHTQNKSKTPSEMLNTTRTFEELKDVQEKNMSLQFQLKKVNESHQMLKQSHDDLLTINKTLENRIFAMDSSIMKYRDDVLMLQNQTQKLTHKEIELVDQLQAERVQVKTFQTQIEKDSKCIMDLNRQIKEMERIIQRKHPDSVSSLIVASRNDLDSVSRKVLEDRIKTLEAESALRNEQNSKVFLDVQDKFNQMKRKYESHIEDLELHVADLKAQMKNRIDTYDVYTQTITMKTKTSVENLHSKTATSANQKKVENKDTHLLATIRGLQADLLNKDKAILKLQKELDELKKTNRRLQKEREGSLKNLCVKQLEGGSKKDAQEDKQKINDIGQSDLIEKIKELKSEKERMQKQLCKIENDFQGLKRKRIEDLTKLQEAHEQEISSYLTNMTPLREQLEIQQISLNSLQQQLTVAKEELSVTSVERDHLNNKLQLHNSTALVSRKMDFNFAEDSSEINHLKKKMSSMEVMYGEREERLRAIIHGLAQKNIMNRNCDQCSNRQQQLIGYKAELDQLIATVRCLQ